ncbi:MAG TPA: 30S ribosomal protein S12 methylthiotransferase RimO [Bacteroidales bacterium]|nr:30S ribosomal protein S12 methylthiotransferase RimO [Bacteroidales bacterium]
MVKNAKKINIITLGCSKNLTDSEQFAFQLSNAGYKVVHNSDKTDFQIAFINTCGFINDAKEESINTIIELVNLKKQRDKYKNKKIKLEKIIVFGCLVQRYEKELKAEIPEVDFYVGNYNAEQLLQIVELKQDKRTAYNRIPDSAGHYAYLKIAEGCNRNCSFCAIPLIKGKYVSRKVVDILEEARILTKTGVKELILIAQDLCFYGYDFEKEFLLPELVNSLCEIDGIEWIRLQYLYPFLFPEKLLDVIADNPKVCKYIDIPLQHISDKVLKKMNRACTKQEIVDLLDRIRTKIPDATIRTTMLVGHPGEGKKEFNELMEFVKEQRFDRLGVFTYSQEEGTKAAVDYKDIISSAVKEKRAEILMNEQSKISNELNANKVGKIFKVIIDSKDTDFYIGRTEYDSVEVDNEVIVNCDEKLEIGEYYDVKINGFDDFDLYGEKI